MAKIVLSADAPDEAKAFSLGNAEIEVPYETDDPTLLGNATTHPWLEVEYDEADAVDLGDAPPGVDPTKDPLSAQGPNANIAFDADAVREFEESKREGVADPVAIDAGRDQDESVFIGDTAVTTAADEDTASDAPSFNLGDNE